MKQPTRTGSPFPHVSMTMLVLAALFLCTQAPASAMQILEAADHAELEAEISDRAVSRIALAGDRITRVIRGPDGFAVEHDGSRGDVYLRPLERAGASREPVTLFIGTTGGFTYRLNLRVSARGSAQVLIRNASAGPRPEFQRPGDGRVGALVAFIRAVARREVPPGYSIETFSGTSMSDDPAIIEVWRGPRFIARVLETSEGQGDDPARLAPGAAALWPAGPGSGPSGGRLAVAVHEVSRSTETGGVR